MAPSDTSFVVCLLIIGFHCSHVEGQGTQTGGNPYRLDSAFIQDPFYNPSPSQQQYNLYPDPAPFPPQYQVIATPPYSYQYNPSPISLDQYLAPNYQNPNPAPNYYQNPNPVLNNQNPKPAPNYQIPNPALTNYYDPSYSYNPNPAPNYDPNYALSNTDYGANTYSGYSQYQHGYTTSVPPTQSSTPTTTQPPTLAPAASSRRGGDEQEVDEGARGRSRGPVFNYQVYSPLLPQPAEPAWPHRTIQTANSGGSFGSGRLYALPHAVGGQGLLESLTRVRHHRQQRRLGGVTNTAVNPLFLLLALD